MKKRNLLLTLGITALCVILVVTLLVYTLNPPTALQRAINFINGAREPYALLWLDVMHRQFGIAAFADALQRYDQELAERTDEAPLLRVFRRIADHDNQLQDGDLQAVVIEVDRITVPALYCDQQELTINYPAMLQGAAFQGGYLLTHALLACVWFQENGCAVPLPASFVNDMYLATASLIGDDPVVTDLELEAAAFLYLAGQGELVKDSFVELVITVQNSDGGWLLSSDTPGNSDWHPTILGLFLLLHREYPADSYPPMLAPASP
jgi:hypothetical protein